MSIAFMKSGINKKEVFFKKLLATRAAACYNVSNDNNI